MSVRVKKSKHDGKTHNKRTNKTPSGSDNESKREGEIEVNVKNGNESI